MKTIKRLLIAILSILVLGASAWFFLNKHVEKQTVYTDKDSSTTSTTKGFVAKDSETAEWAKSEYQDLELAIKVAVSGDRGALYMTGLAFLFGNGMPIDVKSANMYFAKSASLGFAPALDKIRAMYLEDTPNLGLIMVYLNLTIAFGHPELIQTYHKFMADLKEDFGSSLIQNEIEKIAREKYAMILRNQDKFKNTANKENFVFKMEDVTALDSTIYTSKYWEEIFKAK